MHFLQLLRAVYTYYVSEKHHKWVFKKKKKRFLNKYFILLFYYLYPFHYNSLQMMFKTLDE